MLRPELGLRRLPPAARLREIQERTTCKQCRLPGEVWIALPSERIFEVKRSMSFTWHNYPYSHRES